MAKSIIDDVLGAGGEPDPESQPLSPETTGDLVSIDAGTVAMLDFRFRDGKRAAYPYSYLASVSFDPSGPIVCRFASATVTLKGRNLAPVYAAITSQTALAITESESGFDEGGKTPFVESIDIAADSQ